jgi:hypothetical protein
MKMKIRNLATTLLTITLSLGASQAALAEDFTTHGHLCGDQLNTVVAQIAATEFAQPAEVGRLQSKVTAADGKLHVGKPDDAYYKLEDITSKVLSLLSNTRKEKIDPIEGPQIITDVEAAQACIDLNRDSF